MNKPQSSQNLPLACVILAAGQGTRMKSSLPKVLHPVAGLPMIQHVVGACTELAPEKIVVVIAPGMDSVASAVAPHATAIQKEPLGTGDAVKAAREALSGFQGHIIVLFGDTPLVTSASLSHLMTRQKETGADIVVSGFTPADAAAYGRLMVAPNGALEAIVEAADASEEQRAVKLCNGGIMLFKAEKLWPLLDKIKNDNAKKEYYLTDCIEILNNEGGKAVVADMPVEDVSGVNSRVQLAEAEKIMQQRLRNRAMLAGATMIDPDSVFLSVDTQIGRDVVIGPNVVFGPGVSLADTVEIKAFCHLEGVSVAAGAIIGPFARLRPGSTIGEGAHIGNFVEIKKSDVAAGAKINHLSYIGDASVGEKTNIGAGTITCNYDGFRKLRTEIGANVFVGSNTALVAPVRIGDGALIAAGSTITMDVEANALAIARERQSVAEGGASKFREGKKKS